MADNVGVLGFTLHVDGAPQFSLANIQVRIISGHQLDGQEMHYDGSASTDGQGRISTIDLSGPSVEAGDPVTVMVLTDSNFGVVFNTSVMSTVS